MFRSVSVAVGVVDALPGRLSKHTPHLHECGSWAGLDKQPSAHRGHQDNPPRRCSMRSIVSVFLSLARPRTLSQPRVSAGRCCYLFAPGCLGGTPRGEILGLESVPAATARQWPALETPEMPPICSVLPTPLAPRTIAPDLDALSHQTRLGSFLEAIARAIAVPLWWGKDCNCWQLRMPRHAPPAGAPPFPVKLYPDWACSSLCIVK